MTEACKFSSEVNGFLICMCHLLAISRQERFLSRWMQATFLLASSLQRACCCISLPVGQYSSLATPIQFGSYFEFVRFHNFCVKQLEWGKLNRRYKICIWSEKGWKWSQIAIENITQYICDHRIQTQTQDSKKGTAKYSASIPFTPSRWDRQIHRLVALDFQFRSLAKKLILTQLLDLSQCRRIHLRRTGFSSSKNIGGG